MTGTYTYRDILNFMCEHDLEPWSVIHWARLRYLLPVSALSTYLEMDVKRKAMYANRND